jgi:hypothetical protein
VKQPLPGAFSRQFKGSLLFFHGKIIQAFSKIQVVEHHSCYISLNNRHPALASGCLLFPMNEQR